jgi:tRNA modification GTPase
MLHYGTIRDPKSDKILDQVLLTIMRKPRSYTGEDVVEVHCHGGVFLVQRILGLVLSQGARHAEPGEFTKRAFLNGRLDLAPAEAVLDLIAARTEKS